MLQALFYGDMCTNHGAVWYVSVLLIVTIVLSSVLKGNRCIKLSAVTLFIMLGLFSKSFFGEWCIATYNINGNLTLWPGIIRGLSEMSVGIAVFYLGRKIQVFFLQYRRSCIMLETVIMVIIIVYTYFRLDNQLIIIVGLSIALMFSFYTQHSIGDLEKKVLGKWAKVTYAIYLNHPVLILLFKNNLKLHELLIIVTIYSFITSAIIDRIVLSAREIVCLRKNSI